MPRILVADDNTNIQKMVSLAFAERGVDVIAVGNGEAAVRRIPDANPDLILADVFMPVRNGYEVCEFVKKDTRFAHVPVILLVGAFDPLDEKEARRVGADGVLKKPFVPPDPLIAMVMSALEKNPKIAAELAKAKEAPVETAPPPIALENPAMIEPKPLPEFPEPTPEEAAAIYGFGKGVRSFGDEEEQEAKASKEPKPPKAEAKDEEEEEEFDSAATSRDWRRTAGMDLDIPENTAADPAYSYGRNLAPITFPSEKDVPPRRIPVEEVSEEREAVAHSTAPPPAAQTIVPTPAAEPEPQPEPLMGSRARSWMDAISGSSPSEAPDSGWMSRTNPDHASTEHAQAAPASTFSTETSAEASRESAPAAPATGSAEGEPGFFADEQPQKKSWFTDAVEAVREVVHGMAHEASREPEPELVHTNVPHEEHAEAAPVEVQPVEEAHVEEERAEETHFPAHEQEPEPVTSSASDFGAGSIFSSPAPIHSYKEPDLEEPPAAHVTPEPLLVNDTPSGPSDYGKRPELTGPIHSFMPPALEPPVAHESGMDEASIGAGSNAFGFSHPAPDPEGFGERIPTAPPPNREALSGIPFLMPPAAESDSGKMAPDQVDAVVQRVIERLEPQLHDLLSKGLLKPLVENLLQSELAKKEK